MARRASPLSLLSFRLQRPARLVTHARRILRDHLVIERDHRYSPVEVSPLARAVYLRGYWQSDRYFSDISSTIRKELTYPEPPTGKNAELLARIREEDAICLHIRRGDYVSDPHTAAFHGVCSSAYYDRAIARLLPVAKKPIFYVFSDDPEWARSNIIPPGETIYVDHNSCTEPFEDLRLMSACRHFVIANSSFSWWAAWLSDRAGKQVIAPQKWFQSEEKDTSDQTPTDWYRI